MEEDLSADGWLGKEGGEGKVSKEEKINMSHMCKYIKDQRLSGLWSGESGFGRNSIKQNVCFKHQMVRLNF